MRLHIYWYEEDICLAIRFMSAIIKHKVQSQKVNLSCTCSGGTEGEKRCSSTKSEPLH